jgi:hypothetical protein
MGVEWFRDLSITILGFVTSAVLIFMAIMAFRLYREAKSTLLIVKATAKTVQETVAMVQESIKPMLPIMAIIQAVRSGFEFVRKMCNKESNEEGDDNE